MQTRNLTLDAIRGIAILIVMIGHVLVWNNMTDPFLYDAIKVVQMPLFMLVSGYLTGKSTPITSLPDIGNVLKKRGTSYLVPFFSWIFITHITNFGWALKATLFQLERGLWFLMTLFILTAMVYLAQYLQSIISKEGRKAEIMFWLFYGILGGLILLQSRSGNQFLSPDLTKYYAPFYMAGYFIAKYCGRLWQLTVPFIRKSIWILSISVFVYLVFRYDLIRVETMVQLIRQLAAAAAGCFAIIYSFIQFGQAANSKLLILLGQHSLEIYAVHYHFANILNVNNEVFYLYSIKGFIYAVLSFFTMSIITFVIIYVVSKIPILNLLLFGKLKRKKN